MGLPAERLLDRVLKTESCWLWQGACTRGGYGELMIDGKMWYAHRLSHELFKGPIPPGLDIDHLCRVRNCVNPDHLEAVTRKVNANRGLCGIHNLRKTHCPRGHLLAGDNLRISGIRRGVRLCKQCRKMMGN